MGDGNGMVVSDEVINTYILSAKQNGRFFAGGREPREEEGGEVRKSHMRIGRKL
jgi:hypothetical protein